MSSSSVGNLLTLSMLFAPSPRRMEGLCVTIVVTNLVVSKLCRCELHGWPTGLISAGSGDIFGAWNLVWPNTEGLIGTNDVRGLRFLMIRQFVREFRNLSLQEIVHNDNKTLSWKSNDRFTIARLAERTTGCISDSEAWSPFTTSSKVCHVRPKLECMSLRDAWGSQPLIKPKIESTRFILYYY